MFRSPQTHILVLVCTVSMGGLAGTATVLADPGAPIYYGQDADSPLVLKQANRGCGVSRDFGGTAGAEWSW